MAYNNNNKFLRIKDIQDTYLLHKTDGNSTRWVYREIIYPRWKISIATLYNYLATNVKKELRQINMFPD